MRSNESDSVLLNGKYAAEIEKQGIKRIKKPPVRFLDFFPIETMRIITKASSEFYEKSRENSEFRRAFEQGSYFQKSSVKRFFAAERNNELPFCRRSCGFFKAFFGQKNNIFSRLAEIAMSYGYVYVAQNPRLSVQNKAWIERKAI